MPLKTQLDLCIEVDVLTAGSAAELVNSILETLLYQRNQIPFVYKTYRYYINKWQEQKDIQSLSGDSRSVRSYEVERKKQLAVTTKEAISSMRQTIRNVFETKSVKTLRFLFGSTIFTAKEAYTIHIPVENIAVNHFHEHHKISQSTLNQTLLALLTSQDLYTIFSNHLNPTNIYLELELLGTETISSKDPLQNSQIFPKDLYTLPTKCKDVHIYLQHKHSDPLDHKYLRCCKELQVFEDLISLNLNSNSEHQTKGKETNDMLTNLTSVWWEAEIVVRGFKDHPIKGSNIWT